MSRRLVIILLAMLLPLVAVAADTVRGLHVQGSIGARTLWVVKVEQGEKPESRRSEVYARKEHDAAWSLVSTIPSEVVSATSHRGNLVLLLSSGEWLILNQATGRSLPERAQILALAGDEQALWSIGTPRRATTGPATLPATAPAVEVEGTPAAQLYRLERAGWKAVTATPDGVEPGRFALGLVNELPTLAVLRGDDVVVEQWREGQWQELARHPSGGLRPEQLLHVEGHTLVYLGARQGPSQLLVHGTKWLDPVALPAEGAVRALGAGGGQIRFVYAEGDVIKERRLDARDLRVAGEDAVLALAPPVNIQEVHQWVNWVLMVVITLVMLHTYRKREAYRQVKVDWKKVKLAPFGRRFFAGMIDLIPVLFGMLYTRAHMPGIETPGDLVASSAAMNMVAIGTIIFIAHTTLFEVFAGRSIGKIVTHLRVVRMDGGRPGPIAMIMRNLLRVVDLVLWFTLVLMLYLPLRQRIGDLAGGTIVVADIDDASHGPNE